MLVLCSSKYYEEHEDLLVSSGDEKYDKVMFGRWLRRRRDKKEDCSVGRKEKLEYDGKSLGRKNVAG
jgi:hypothetical protein